MAMITVGDRTVETMWINQSGGVLSMMLDGQDTALSDWAAVFAGAPQIRVLDGQGMTQALYQAHALTALSVETEDGMRRVRAALQAEPLEQTMAAKLGERLDAQQARMEAQEEAGRMLGRMARARMGAGGVTANEAIAMAPALQAWAPGAYAVGDVRNHEGAPYRCAQAHDSADNPAWTPPATPALWTPYHATAREFALPWQMPTGAHDAYNAGEWMIFTDGQAYRCTRDGAVWGPDQVADAWEVMKT